MKPVEHDVTHPFCIGWVSDLLCYVSIVYHHGDTVTKMKSRANPHLWAHVSNEGLLCWYPDSTAAEAVMQKLSSPREEATATSEAGSETAKSDLAAKLTKHGAVVLDQLFDGCERAADDMHLTEPGVNQLLDNMKDKLEFTSNSLIMVDSSIVPHQSEKVWRYGRERCLPIVNSHYADLVASEKASKALGCSVRACSGSGMFTKDGGYAKHLFCCPEHIFADKVIFISSGNDYFSSGRSISSMNKHVKHGIAMLKAYLNDRAEFYFCLDHDVQDEVDPMDHGFVYQQAIVGEAIT